MDIKREGVARRKRIRFIIYGILAIGALGAVEFFRGARSKDKLLLAARASNDGMGWADLPQPNMQPSENTPAIEKEQIKVESRQMFEEKFKKMTRFAIAYVSSSGAGGAKSAFFHLRVHFQI